MMFKLTDVEGIYYKERKGCWMEYPCFGSYTADSRTVENGSLFAAWKGEKNDGNEYIKQAVDAGASFVIAEYIHDEAWIGDVPVLLTDDVPRTLLSLASHVRSKLNQRIIAVTGSYGKTTTKDMIYAVLKDHFKTGRTRGNLNTEWGVPHTILNNMDKDIVVVEMGMDRFGDIDVLSRAIAPDIGIITNIGPVHLEFLGNTENVLLGKLGLFREMDEGGLKMVNGDDARLFSIRKAFSNIQTYGFNKENDIVFTKKAGSFCREGDCFSLDVWGDFNLYNAMAAVIIAGKLGLEMKEAAEGLNKVELSNGRSKLFHIHEKVVIDDTYNASPGAVKAVLNEIRELYRNKNILLCLGDMLELGDESPARHLEVMDMVSSMANAKGLFLGKQYKNAGSGKSEHECLTSRELYAARIMEIVEGYDVVLFKGSRSMRMEEFLDKVREYL